MKEIPVFLSKDEILEVLDGIRSWIRREVRPSQPVHPYGEPGDRLYARETWQYYGFTEDGEPIIRYRADDAREICENIPEEWWDRIGEEFISLSEPDNFNIQGRACDQGWRSPVGMPKWAARIWLDVTGAAIHEYAGGRYWFIEFKRRINGED